MFKKFSQHTSCVQYPPNMCLAGYIYINNVHMEVRPLILRFLYRYHTKNTGPSRYKFIHIQKKFLWVQKTLNLQGKKAGIKTEI